MRLAQKALRQELVSVEGDKHLVRLIHAALYNQSRYTYHRDTKATWLDQNLLSRRGCRDRGAEHAEIA